MCFTSAVFDQWNPYVPDPNRTTWPMPSPTPGVEYPSAKEVRELIDSFKEAVKAAKTFESAHEPAGL